MIVYEWHGLTHPRLTAQHQIPAARAHQSPLFVSKVSCFCMWMFYFLNKDRLKTWPNTAVTIVRWFQCLWAGIGGVPTALSGLLRHTCKWTSRVVAGGCLLIYTLRGYPVHAVHAQDSMSICVSVLSAVAGIDLFFFLVFFPPPQSLYFKIAVTCLFHICTL